MANGGLRFIRGHPSAILKHPAVKYLWFLQKEALGRFIELLQTYQTHHIISNLPQLWVEGLVPKRYLQVWILDWQTTHQLFQTSLFACSCFKHFQARRNSGLWRKRSWGNSVYQHADAIAKASDPNIGYQFLTTSKWTHCLNVIAAGPFFRVSDFFWAIAIEKISAFTIEDFQNCRFGTINFKRTIESGQNEKMGFMISFIFPED